MHLTMHLAIDAAAAASAPAGAAARAVCGKVRVVRGHVAQDVEPRSLAQACNLLTPYISQIPHTASVQHLRLLLTSHP